MRRAFGAWTVAVLAAGVLTACGQEEERERAAPATTEAVATATATKEEPAGEVTATTIDITGKEYAFDVPATVKGGLAEISFTNVGREPHFAALAKVLPGKTFDEAKAALTAPPPDAPPPGPPPFEDLGAVPTLDPGGKGNATFNLPAGTYALFCQIPAPDGVSHAAKGMVSQVTVTEGPEGRLPPSVGTVTATDFALTPVPPLNAGRNVVRLRNEGKQLHEISLVDLGAGKKVEDVVAWYRQPSGPPPMRRMGGVAIRPGQEATTELALEAGPTYAFICEIPDFLGDFAPHVTKGMFTRPFSVS